MKVVESVAELVEHRRTRGAGATGFVPTLGALHEGHVSLLRRAKAENARAWASIFVNPAQFDDPGDLERYPRTTEQDLAMLRMPAATWYSCRARTRSTATAIAIA